MTKSSQNSADLHRKKISATAPNSWRQTRLILLSLPALTLLAFLPVLRCDFINYDDGKIIAANPHVREGLSAPSLYWAWTTFSLGYLQPVTLTSFIIDADLFGVEHPGAFHATNLAIHIVNVLLLYLLLASATGSRYRSALVAAIFAVHPLQVESVAWVAERKGLLATCFALLAMIAYVRYARSARRPWQGSRLILYAVTLVLLTLSLLSKPIFIVFPGLLLLADVWPLRRFAFSKDLPLGTLQSATIESNSSSIARASHGGDALAPSPPYSGERAGVRGRSRERRNSTHYVSPLTPTLSPEYEGEGARNVRPLAEVFLEKLPYLIVIVVVIFLGIYGQRALGSSVGESTLPLLTRLAGAAIVCARSVWKSIACIHLALPYPEPRSWPVMEVIASLILITAITALAIWRFQRAPWLLVGWLAFLTLLAPITGIIPFGGHRLADRYNYVPLICLAVMALWSIPPIRFGQASAPADRSGRNSAAGAPTGGLEARDSAGESTGGTECAKPLRSVSTLRTKCIFIYAVLAATVIGTLATLTFFQARHWRNSFTLFEHTLGITQNNATAHTLLGNAYLQRDEPADVPRALEHFEHALDITPDDQPANLDAGVALQKLGRSSDAIVHLRKAADFNSRTADGLAAVQALGDVLQDQGKIDDAISQYHLILQIAPDSAQARCNLGMALGKQGRLDEAIGELNRAIDENPKLPQAQRYRATVLLLMGQPDQAYESFRMALALNPKSPEGWLGLGNACAALHRVDDAMFAYRRALELRPGYPAAQKRFDQVRAAARK